MNKRAIKICFIVKNQFKVGIKIVEKRRHIKERKKERSEFLENA